MAQNLQHATVAILAADGVEQAELDQPRHAVEQAGARVEILSISTDPIQAVNDDIHPADKIEVDRPVAQVGVEDYDALILPGGAVNPDTLRQDDDAVAFVGRFVESGKPVAVICHGPWTLVEADVVRGRTLTSFPSIRTDLRNAGANVVDQEVVVDGNLISSRDPDDSPAFCATIVDALGRAVGARS